MSGWVKCPVCGQNNMPGDDRCVKCRSSLAPPEPPKPASPMEAVPPPGFADQQRSPDIPVSIWNQDMTMSSLGSYRWYALAGGVLGAVLGFLLKYYLVTHFDWALAWDNVHLFPNASYRARRWTLLRLVVVVPLVVAGTLGGYILARRMQSR